MLNTSEREAAVVFIGLGSNLQQPYLQIKKAISALNALPGTNVLNDSGYFKSKPMGPEDQPDYINAVLEIETTLPAAELLKHCQLIEQQQGRIKKRHWGERTIDLDILLYADEQIKTEALSVPHPGICERDFVYLPLLRLRPEIQVPGKGMLKDIVNIETKKFIEAATKTLDNTDFSCQFVGSIE